MAKFMAKFKVGDIVVCVDGTSNDIINGGGWKKDLVFKITSVSELLIQNTTYTLYFGGYEGHGVYEHALELKGLEYYIREILKNQQRKEQINENQRKITKIKNSKLHSRK